MSYLTKSEILEKVARFLGDRESSLVIEQDNGIMMIALYEPQGLPIDGISNAITEETLPLDDVDSHNDDHSNDLSEANVTFGILD